MVESNKVSVLMPVYNEKTDFLKNALESILNQTFKEFEFIIIDDASEDYVGNIISEYNDNRIKYIKLSQNSKICAALNTGLNTAKGKYIAIMHSDDFSVKTRLEKQFQILEQYKNVGIVNSYTAARFESIVSINMPYTNSNDEKIFLKYIGNNIIHPNVMFRREICDKNNLQYNAKFVFAEDYRLWTDMIDFCDIYTIPEILTIYNVNINPKRQNKIYMDKCRKVILLENYEKDFNFDYSNLIESIWNKNEIKYLDYLKIKRNLAPLIKNRIQEKISSKKNYYEFSKFLSKTIESFNPIKRVEYEFI